MLQLFVVLLFFFILYIYFEINPTTIKAIIVVNVKAINKVSFFSSGKDVLSSNVLTALSVSYTDTVVVTVSGKLVVVLAAVLCCK